MFRIEYYIKGTRLIHRNFEYSTRQLRLVESASHLYSSEKLELTFDMNGVYNDRFIKIIHENGTIFTQYLTITSQEAILEFAEKYHKEHLNLCLWMITPPFITKKFFNAHFNNSDMLNKLCPDEMFTNALLNKFKKMEKQYHLKKLVNTGPYYREIYKPPALCILGFMRL